MALKNFVIIAIVGLLVVAGVILAQRNQMRKEQIVTSDDGIVQLTLSQKALPKGTDVKSIRISKVNLKETEKGVYLYALEPDGLILSEPAKVEMTLKDTGDEVPILLHFSKEKVLSLEDVVVMRDDQEHKTKISAKLSHFSYLLEINEIIRIYTDIPSRDVEVLDSFSIKTWISNANQDIIITAAIAEGPEILSIPQLGDTWTAEGLIKVDERFQHAIDPVEVGDVPRLTKMQGDKKDVLSSAEFTCKAAAKGIGFQYQVTLTGEIVMSLFFREMKEQKKDILEPNKNFKEKITVITDRTVDCHPLKIEYKDPAVQDLVPLEVLVINGKLFPAAQFNKAGEDVGCPASHYHSQFEVSNIDLDTHLSDPNPKGCGFGTVDIVPRKTEMVSRKKANQF